MARLKSLPGVAGAKRAGEATTRAFRKLFGRQPSAAGNSSPSTSSNTNSSTSSSDSDGHGHDAGVTSNNRDGKAVDPTTNSSTTADDTPRPLASSAAHLQAGQQNDIHKADDEALPSSRSLPPATANATAATEPTSDSVHSHETPTNDTMSRVSFPQTQQQERLQKQELGKENQPFTSGPTANKENQPPARYGNDVAGLTSSLGKLGLQEREAETPSVKDQDAETLSVKEPVRPLTPFEELTEEQKAIRLEREKHLVFIEEALDMARLALRTNETPVGCVLVHNEKVIARGMNATNVTRNGTRHAEFMALSALLSYPPKDGPRTTSLKPRMERTSDDELDDDASTVSPQPDEGNEDGSKGHLYPYGQKLHPDERVDRSILRESILYVTVEPCVMCASLLRQLGIKKVFFGAVNDKFGGTGGVFSIHANSLPVRDDGQTASAHPSAPTMRLPDGNQVLGTSFPPGGGDGGNVEPGYEIEGGWGRDEAVGLLRRFYVQENGRAPVPRKKEGRAARLAAMMEKDDGASTNSGSVSGGTADGDDLAPSGAADNSSNAYDGDASSRPGSSHVRESDEASGRTKDAAYEQGA